LPLSFVARERAVLKAFDKDLTDGAGERAGGERRDAEPDQHAAGHDPHQRRGRSKAKARRRGAADQADDCRSRAIALERHLVELAELPHHTQIDRSDACDVYDRERHKTDFGHEAGLLLPLQKLEIQSVVTDESPQAPGSKQVMAVFSLAGKSYAAPIGVEKGSDFKIYADEAFFLEDPRDLYKHWPADVWQKIDAHEVQAGMNELQAGFAIGLGVPEGSGDYGSRTLRYANGGKPLVVTFQNDKALDIKPGT